MVSAVNICEGTGMIQDMENLASKSPGFPLKVVPT